MNMILTKVLKGHMIVKQFHMIVIFILVFSVFFFFFDFVF
jgi:preprotein translocase subunit SecE